MPVRMSPEQFQGLFGRPTVEPAAEPAALQRKSKGRVLPGHTPGAMNSAEKKYAEYLDTKIYYCDILSCEFEAVTLTLARPPQAQAARWTPDFVVLRSDLELELVDVTGTRPVDEQAQRVKIKLAAEKFFFWHFVVARQIPKREGGGWRHESI